MTETRWYEAPEHPIAHKGVTVTTYHGSITTPMIRVEGPSLNLDWLEQHYRLKPRPRPIIGDP